ncbi:hypothetical protein TNCT_571161 [Trichonephila clavata]|uniref:Uncharacterized protein n=1 Tax=Trichonephila clavata TaxID=2740835 RepID=A0A8X6F4P9_TRICU|nr:hypothetical protein TNCT_571161 [Trichonephila clavata]
MLNLVIKQLPAKIENLRFDEVKGEKKPSYLESGKEVPGGDESSLLHTVTSATINICIFITVDDGAFLKRILLDCSIFFLDHNASKTFRFNG